MNPITVNLEWLLRLAALLAFIAALCFAESWLTIGTWQEWVAGGLALYVLADVA